MADKISLLNDYIENVKNIYGSHIKKIILFGSYARGDFDSNSDIDIMILLDISDLEAKGYQRALFDTTYDFNMDNDVDINPMTHSEELFLKWIDAYPFFKNIDRDGVVLYGAA
ncbi:MAG: nucleotidyltransferase domain-containing protein [Pseudobutyrivibrio sp.]|nr:nucleotidyltransferase domain-containing protein [Pseudobutyrivibrio sp.]